MNSRLIVLALLVVTLSLLVAVACAQAQNPGTPPPRTPEGLDEASELAPLPTEGRSRTMLAWAMWLVGGLLLFAGIIYLIRPKI